MNHHPHPAPPFYPRGTFENRDIARGDRAAVIFVLGILVGCIIMLVVHFVPGG